MILSILENKPLRTFIGRLIHWPGEVIQTVTDTATTAAAWGIGSWLALVGGVVMLAVCAVLLVVSEFAGWLHRGPK